MRFVPVGQKTLMDPEIPLSRAESKPSLVLNARTMICPKCKIERNTLDEGQIKPLEMVSEYAHELNPVYVCVRQSGGCGHVFSPGNPEIISAYLSGALIPAPILNTDKEDEVLNS